eukprot:scaffold1760_cov71-Cylindrotheca_fusiformis.AAC.1
MPEVMCCWSALGEELVVAAPTEALGIDDGAALGETLTKRQLSKSHSHNNNKNSLNVYFGHPQIKSNENSKMRTDEKDNAAFHGRESVLLKR